MTNSMSYREKPGAVIGLGIDAGGTFTDSVIYNLGDNRLLAKNKSLTTKWDFSESINESLKGLDAGILKSVDLVALSTTFATNAIVENQGQKVGLLLICRAKRPADNPSLRGIIHREYDRKFLMK